MILAMSISIISPEEEIHWNPLMQFDRAILHSLLVIQKRVLLMTSLKHS